MISVTKIHIKIRWWSWQAPVWRCKSQIAPATVYMKHSFYLKGQFIAYDYGNIGIWQIFFQKWVSQSLQQKQLIVLFDQGQNLSFKRKFEFWKICIYLCDIDNFPAFNFFSNKIDSNKYNIFTLHNEMCQHWKDLHKHFPNKCILIKD